MVRKIFAPYSAKTNPRTTGLLFNETKPNLENAYTVLKLNHVGNKAFMGAAAIGLTVNSYVAPERNQRKQTEEYIRQQQEEEGISSLPSTRGDMTGYRSAGQFALDTLESQGNLGYALNKLGKSNMI